LANTVVKAKTFFTREDNGFARPWQGRVWLNPPGGLCDVDGRPLYPKTKDSDGCSVTGACGLAPGHQHQGVTSSAKAWWYRLAEEYVAGRVTTAIFVGFSIEVLQSTQVDPPDGLPLPHEFPMCFPARRVPYLREREPDPTLSLFGDEPALDAGDAPPHASVLVYLPPRGDIKALCRFAMNFERVGAMVGPWPGAPIPNMVAWSRWRQGRLCSAWWFTTPGELIVDVLRRAGHRGLPETDLRSAVLDRFGQDEGEAFDASLQDLRDRAEVALLCEKTGPGRFMLADGVK
jgi:hypothetical protein